MSETVQETVRQFGTGATRDTDSGKYDYEGFLSPVVLQRFAKYMHQHRIQSDGKLRDADNWQKGMPVDEYTKSLIRHVMDLWLIHDGYAAVRPENGERVEYEDTLCAILFNVQGLLYERLHRPAGMSPRELEEDL